MRNSENLVRHKYEAAGFKVYDSGWPDFLVEKDGKFFGVEVKMQNGTGGGAIALGEKQVEMQIALHRAGITTTIEYVNGPNYKRPKTEEEKEKTLLERAFGGENKVHSPIKKNLLTSSENSAKLILACEKAREAKETV